AGQGRVQSDPGGNMGQIQVNTTDAGAEVDGERSSVKTKHPLLSDPAVRQALALLVDRAAIQEHIYGRTGTLTANFLSNPERYRSKNTKWEFNIEKANRLLEAGGGERGPDGIRSQAGQQH